MMTFPKNFLWGGATAANQIVDADSRIITADHNVDPLIYIQAFENNAPLYIRNPWAEPVIPSSAR